MNRLNVALRLGGVAVLFTLVASAQQPPVNLMAQHPAGEPVCVHPIPAHPGGDSVPCVHARPCHTTDPSTVPCVHKVQQHANDGTMKVPCTHMKRPHGKHAGIPCKCPMVPEHPAGDDVPKPCTHFVSQHESDPGPPVPCTHQCKEHDHDTIPCTHMSGFQHPNGDPGPKPPCAHPLPPPQDSSPPPNAYQLYIYDGPLRAQVRQAISEVQAKGVIVGAPRPLLVFNHPPANGNPNNSSDPLWSHYDPTRHAIQLTRGRPLDDLSQTIRHELGHAILGHKGIHNTSHGGTHGFCDTLPGGTAMEEGWADFVAVMLLNNGGTLSGWSVEDPGRNECKTKSGSLPVPQTENNELRVAAVLWDLYDNTPAEDGVSLPFQCLFSVYGVTSTGAGGNLLALSNGLLIPNLTDYIKRLQQLPCASGKSAAISSIVQKNTTQPLGSK